MIAKKESLATLTAKREELAATIASSETDPQNQPPALESLKSELATVEKEIHLAQLAIDTESARYHAQLTPQKSP